jgi:hypothetical protein
LEVIAGIKPSMPKRIKKIEKIKAIPLNNTLKLPFAKA